MIEVTKMFVEKNVTEVTKNVREQNVFQIKQNMLQKEQKWSRMKIVLKATKPLLYLFLSHSGSLRGLTLMERHSDKTFIF